MSFAGMTKGKELTFIVKLISIFGIVEERQMRQMFSHLEDRDYGKIMTRLYREGMAYLTTDAKYLASNRYSVEKMNLESSVDCFWVLISIKEKIHDFCAGEMPAILTVAGGDRDYDLISVNQRTVNLINETNIDLPDKVVRLLVMRDIGLSTRLERRFSNDFALVVNPNGEVETYEL